MTSIHLIHIGDREERQRAMAAFLDVPETWTSFPGHVLGVTGKHLEALRQLTPPVKFEPATREHINGQNATVQPR